MAAHAYIYDAVRTPRGKGKASGALHGTKPVDLVVGLIQALRERNPGLDEGRIADLVLGIVSPVGDQGMVLPRTAALLAGMPDTVPGLQINRFCGSGLSAVNTAAEKVAAGWEDVVLAGGVESMSRVPMGSDGGAWAMDPATSMRLGFTPQGVSIDLLATIEGITREDVDAYAARSHERAAHAWDQGWFDRSIVPVRDMNGQLVLERDEIVRPEATVESLGALKPSFAAVGAQGGFDAVALQRYPQAERIDHIHTPGNSSGIVDGAALSILATREAGEEMGLTPRARVVATATSGADTVIMLSGPVPASRKALDIAGLSVSDIDLWEVNEAFAAVPIWFGREMGVSEEIINVNGGAIAMGHPLGATGAMLMNTVLDELERRDEQRALITLCIGAGMGVATIIERV
ncbi:acetyl-CoA C-acetyltransferase [Janibacter limosus]|uniref:Acetyl-CoA C-acetyltransferase n=1 Tax=Janibacter limosus TaxID=53458 RepID=A0A4P6MV13_9MICO|nr:acetyl-CoA C-acetyltransferase [Janibacter limosus]QBF47594.1 acetyl-CoA C-acetyltransferase [Janibacter limosus]